MSKNQQAKWLSIGEAAEYLGISRDTLRRWEKKGKLKPIRSPTNHRYYTKQQLDSAIKGEIVEVKTNKTTSLPQKPLLTGLSRTIAIGILSFIATLLFFTLIRSLILK